mmetsp:Transcript_101881/g.185990  ORF Transcript_101881/g.185990 Transcript_101881/m.185990 type:complete len:201 (+) Transcript_101881:108-710(+)
MQKIALVLLGLACVGNAWHVDMTRYEPQSGALEETADPSQKLAMLLLASHAATAFNPSVPMAIPRQVPMASPVAAPIRAPAPVMNRHGVRLKKLNRNENQRKALLRGLTTEVIRHGRIRTTLIRCKVLRRYVDNMVTLAKDGSFRARRRALSYLYDKQLVYALFEQAPERYADRAGGYTRVLKDGFRRGDNAEMGIIELV